MEKEEYLIIVDQYNNIIGKEKRDIIHQKGLIHRDIHILIFNEKREIFLKKRNQNINYPNLWESSVAGHVKYKETYFQAAKRELFEELIIDEKDKKLFNLNFYAIFKNFTNDLDKQYTALFFIENIDNSIQIQVSPTEATKGDFFELNWALKNLKLTPGTIIALKIAKIYLNI